MLVQVAVMGFVDATYTAFKVPITFAIIRDLTVWSISSSIDTAAGQLSMQAFAR